MIHFKIKKDDKATYTREAAYGLLLDGDNIALIKTPRGVFLPGGGIEGEEGHEDCVRREFLEELGMAVVVGYHFASAKLTDVTPSRDYPIDMVGHCYVVADTGERSEAEEEDHELIWMPLGEARSRMKLTHQAWIIEMLLKEQPAVTLSEYNPHWPVWFNQLKYVLEDALGNMVAAIEHIGSTAVTGMIAKAVIDLDLVMKEDGDFNEVCSRLEQLGYSYEGNLGIEGREAFKRDGTNRHELLDALPHHLYVCPDDSQELIRHLHFRDSLRNDDTLRDAYNAMKKEIIDQVGPYNRAGYVEMKAEAYGCFFNDVLDLLEDSSDKTT